MTPCNVLLIAPAFSANTFWHLGATCAVVGARHTQPPLGLMTVAALLPEAWTCRLVDCNVTELTDADLMWADLVMTGGMSVQRFACLAVIETAHRHGKPVVVGGPDVTSDPEAYGEADFVVCGEAEGVIAAFISAWNDGQRRGRFVARMSSVDITRTPVPRYELAQWRDYMHFAVQFSRGCPFTCEFCEAIELFGRVPRVKAVEQFLRELEALYDLGYRGHLDLVDDNFIGNKKAVRVLLPALVEWQRKHHYPFWFTTEASLNLADDLELLALMRQANFGAVFVGIESPDAATLVATSKKQNTRRPIADSVHRIQDAGLFVVGGFIVGFDSEPETVAPGMIACMEEAAIPICMAGLLVALRNTQLASRLTREGRLFSWHWLAGRLHAEGGDQSTLGLNFATSRPRRDVLDDYRRVLDAIYTPSAYFGRVRAVVGRMRRWPTFGAASRAAPRWRLLGLSDQDCRLLGRLLLGALRTGPGALLQTVLLLAWTARSNPKLLNLAGTLAAFYFHLGPFARAVSSATARQISAIDRGDWQTPPLAAIATAATEDSNRPVAKPRGVKEIASL